jgi:hypothetical protein
VSPLTRDTPGGWANDSLVPPRGLLSPVAGTVARLATCSAPLPPIPPRDRVGLCERVPPRTFRLESRSPNVLRVRNRLHVPRIHTHLVPTKMIYGQPHRDWPDKQLISQAVSKNGAPNGPNGPITTPAVSTSPFPALIRTALYDLDQKRLARVIRGSRRASPRIRLARVSLSPVTRAV